MITAIQVAVFVLAFLSKKKFVNLLLAIAYLLVPDEIPMIDEILMFAATARMFYLDAKGNAAADAREQIPAGEDGNDVGT